MDRVCRPSRTEPAGPPKASRGPRSSGPGRYSPALAWRHDVPRREPTLLSAARLQDLLGLSDEELLTVLDADPLAVVAGDLDHKPELPILLDLLADHDESALRSWVRTEGPGGRPIDLLTARDFPAFENALAVFRDRGFVIRGPGASRRARPR
jgi:hypothetical protein